MAHWPSAGLAQSLAHPDQPAEARDAQSQSRDVEGDPLTKPDEQTEAQAGEGRLEGGGGGLDGSWQLTWTHRGTQTGTFV